MVLVSHNILYSYHIILEYPNISDASIIFLFSTISEKRVLKYRVTLSKEFDLVAGICFALYFKFHGSMSPEVFESFCILMNSSRNSTFEN